MTQTNGTFIKWLVTLGSAAFLAWAGVVWRATETVDAAIHEARKEWLNSINEYRQELGDTVAHLHRDAAEMRTEIAVTKQRLKTLERRHQNWLMEHEQSGL